MAIGGSWAEDLDTAAGIVMMIVRLFRCRLENELTG